jgi:hypothetical membrane protein
MSMINALITWVLAFVVILVLIITWQGTHSMIDTILPNALVGLGGNVSLMPTVYNTFFIMMGLGTILVAVITSLKASKNSENG